MVVYYGNQGTISAQTMHNQCTISAKSVHNQERVQEQVYYGKQCTITVVIPSARPPKTLGSRTDIHALTTHGSISRRVERT